MGIRPHSGARSRRTAALLSSGLLLASVLVSFVLMGNFPSELAEAAGPTGPNPPLGIHPRYLYYSPNETIVKQIFQKWQAFGQSSFVEPALGNHEHPSTQMWHTAEDIHCAFVNLPGNERTYAFTFGNTLFLSIDWGLWSNNTSDGADGTGSSCGGVSGTAAIRSWVDARLAAANLDPNITWKVVFQHFQCYDMTTVNYFPMCPSAGHPLDQMEAILTNRGVELVLQAHEHTYSRSPPVKFHNVVQNGSAYDTPGAPVYFVLGTGGDPRTATCRN